MRTEKVIGIDLGTTNSVVGVLDLEDARILMARHGPNKTWTLPSAVAWIPEQRRSVVGHAARSRRGLQPAPVLSVKRLMGKGINRALGDTVLSPPQASALVLEELVGRMKETLAEQRQDFDIPRAVITVPAKYENKSQEDTRKSGELAGLEVVELLHEPVAAAIHFCWQRRRKAAGNEARELDRRVEHLMMFDLGGGTFDVSIVKKMPTGDGFDFETLGIAGDLFLGGDTFDAELAGDLFFRLRQQGCVFKTLDPKEPANLLRVARLLDVAEQIKMRLSEAESCDIEMRDLFLDDAGKQVMLKMTYRRSELETLIDGHLRRTIEFCRNGLEQNKLSIGTIDTIVMVGGSSRIPKAQALVKEAFLAGKEKARGDRIHLHAPEECVGAGAALRAASHGRIWRPTPEGKRLCFRGYATSASQRRDVRIEVLDEAKAGDRPMLITRTHQQIPGELLPKGHGVLFAEVELPPGQSTPYLLKLPDPEKRELAGFEFILRHDPGYVAPLGLYTAANVLSFTLQLQVADARGETRLHQLAPRLTPLPLVRTHTFSAPLKRDAMQLPLYGGWRLIKVVRIPVLEGIPPGATVQLRIDIDGAQRVRCKGMIPGVPEPFEFAVDSPGPEVPPSKQEFAAVRDKVHSLMALVEPSRAAESHMRAMAFESQVEHAFLHGDDALVIERMHQLEDLAAELEQGVQSLRPAMAETEAVIESCLERIGDLEGDATTVRLDEMRANVEENAKAARQAARLTPPDQALYGRAFKNLAMTLDALKKEQRRLFQLRPIGERARAALEYGRSLEVEVSGLDLSETERKRCEQAGQYLTEADQELIDHPKPALDRARAAIDILQPIRESRNEPGQPVESRLDVKRSHGIDLKELLRATDDPQWNQH